MGTGTAGRARPRVALGRVFVRDNGFRAQYAYPYSLVVIGGGERVAAALRALYAVDVTCARRTARLVRRPQGTRVF